MLKLYPVNFVLIEILTFKSQPRKMGLARKQTNKTPLLWAKLQ